MQLMVRLYISVCSFFHKHKDKEKSSRISRAMGWGRKHNSGNSVGDVSCFFSILDKFSFYIFLTKLTKKKLVLQNFF